MTEETNQNPPSPIDFPSRGEKVVRLSDGILFVVTRVARSPRTNRWEAILRGSVIEGHEETIETRVLKREFGYPVESSVS